MDKLIVGKIIKIHGVKGGVKIDPIIDDGVNFADLGGVFVDLDGDFYKFKEVFAVSDKIGVVFENVDSVSVAQKLVGHFVYAKKEILESLVDRNSFFIEDIKGSKVYFENGDEIGIVDEIDNFGAADVFYINSHIYKNLTIPHIEGLIVVFRPEKKELVISKHVFDEVAVYDD